MQTNRINTNFKGIYRTPYSEESIKEVKQQVLPIYNRISNQKVKYFIGRNPFFDSFQSCHKIIADENSSSYEWLKMNAQNHGAKAKDFDEEFIYVISGEKDIQALDNYINERVKEISNNAIKIIKEKHSVWGKLKKLFMSEKNTETDAYANLPEHLKFVFHLIDLEKKETQAFENFALNKIDSKTPKELLVKMMQER